MQGPRGKETTQNWSHTDYNPNHAILCVTLHPSTFLSLFTSSLCTRFAVSQPNGNDIETRSSWLNRAFRDDEAVYWVSIGHYEAVAVGN